MINSIFGFGNNAGIDYMIMESDTLMNSAVKRVEQAAARGELPMNQYDFDSLLAIDYSQLTPSDKNKLIRKVEAIYGSNGINLDINA